MINYFLKTEIFILWQVEFFAMKNSRERKKNRKSCFGHRGYIYVISGIGVSGSMIHHLYQMDIYRRMVPLNQKQYANIGFKCIRNKTIQFLPIYSKCFLSKSEIAAA